MAAGLMPNEGTLTPPWSVSSSGGFEAELLVTQWCLYLFASLANMAATTLTMGGLLPYCGEITCWVVAH